MLLFWKTIQEEKKNKHASIRKFNSTSNERTILTYLFLLYRMENKKKILGSF